MSTAYAGGPLTFYCCTCGAALQNPPATFHLSCPGCPPNEPLNIQSWKPDDRVRVDLDRLRVVLRDAADLREALTNLLNHYIRIAESGGCGNRNPEGESVVVAARAALAPNGP